MSAGFVHLHAHSNFSFMDGASPSRRSLPARAGMEMPHSHSPTIRASKARFAFTSAVRSWASNRSSAARSPSGRLRCSAKRPTYHLKRGSRCRRVGFGRASAASFHLTLLVENHEWLPQSVPAAFPYPPARADVPIIGGCTIWQAAPQGLSACPGARAARRRARRGKMPRARPRSTRKPFPLFCARRLLRGAHSSVTLEGPRPLVGLVSAADALGLPVVATNNVHYRAPGLPPP